MIQTNIKLEKQYIFNDTLNIKSQQFFHLIFSRLLIINDNIKAKLLGTKHDSFAKCSLSKQ